jgi:hypothetical protein
LPAEDAHRDAFWVIAVVGGMSIAKAIEDSLSSVSVAHWTPENAVVLPRFFLFLLTSVRFFIGSNVYFQTVHLEPKHEQAFPRRNYALDFGSAIFHFSILYALAANIKVIPAPPVYLSNESFFLFLCAVLLYDWAWYFASTPYDTAPCIKKWAWYNTLAVFVPCAAIFTAFKYGGIDRSWFELLLAAWILITSLPDLIKMAHGEMPKP